MFKIIYLKCRTMSDRQHIYGRLEPTYNYDKICMKDQKVSVRVDDDLNESLAIEAKKRRQTIGSLARTFLRDGLSRYVSISEAILQNSEETDERLRRLEAMVGSLMHLVVEYQVLSSPRRADESQESYTSRSRNAYKDKIYSATEKGAMIKSVFNVPRK